MNEIDRGFNIFIIKRNGSFSWHHFDTFSSSGNVNAMISFINNIDFNNEIVLIAIRDEASVSMTVAGI